MFNETNFQMTIHAVTIKGVLHENTFVKSRKSAYHLRKLQKASAIFSLRTRDRSTYSEFDCELVAEKFNVHEEFVRRIWKCANVQSVAKVVALNKLRRRNFTIELFHVQAQGYFIPVNEISIEMNQKDPFASDWDLGRKQIRALYWLNILQSWSTVMDLDFIEAAKSNVIDFH